MRIGTVSRELRVLTVGMMALGFARNAHAAQPVDFNRDIRPILSENCYQCHGPDANKRKAELRLDTREGLFRTARRSRDLVPGKPDESELFERIASDDDEIRMPPAEAGHNRCPTEQVDADPTLDRAGGRVEGALGVPAARAGRSVPQVSRGVRPAAQPDRRFILRPLAAAGAEPVAGGRPRDADPPAVAST